MKKQSYQDKLKSPKWQKKRLEIMKRDKFKCKVCGRDNEMLHVHHSYYDRNLNPWEYSNDSLITLCEKCHNVWHYIDNYKPKCWEYFYAVSNYFMNN